MKPNSLIETIKYLVVCNFGHCLYLRFWASFKRSALAATCAVDMTFWGLVPGGQIRYVLIYIISVLTVLGLLLVLLCSSTIFSVVYRI